MILLLLFITVKRVIWGYYRFGGNVWKRRFCLFFVFAIGGW
jgi:hypothetical protein